MQEVKLNFPFTSVVETVGEGDDKKPKVIDVVQVRHATAGDNLRVTKQFHPGLDSEAWANMLLLREVCSLDHQDFDNMHATDLAAVEKAYHEEMGLGVDKRLTDPK